METLFGEIRLLRDYYVAGDGSSCVPLDESLGLIEGYSPGLAKMMALIAAQDSFEEGSKDLLAYAGVKVGPKAIARMTKLVAPQMRAAHAAAKPEQTMAAIPLLYFRAQGLFIDFGVVEAGCKTVVGKRLKNSGMFWSVKDAQNVLDLRTFLLSNRFDRLWLARDQKAA